MKGLQLKDIDFSKISLIVQKTIEEQKANGVNLFSEIKSTIQDVVDFSPFNKQIDLYQANFNIKDVFNHYISENMYSAWNGQTLKLGLALDKKTNAIHYADSNFSGSEAGYVLYVNLNLFGLKKICVAQQIDEINAEENRIVFSYVEGGKSRGKQIIQFVDQGANKTKIEHITYYKNESAFRDKYLYPFFHRKVIGEFHRNLTSSLKRKLVN